MSSHQIWTNSKARLTLCRSNNEKNFNWLFLPGGPGLGSEYFIDLVNILNLPGKTWLVDFPDDGSNISKNNDRHFENWQNSLIEAVNEFENVILVAHSSGGMFALATPEIEKNLLGLILMNSAPDDSWQKSFAKYAEEKPIIEVEELQEIFQKNPSNDLLKKITLLCAPYYSMKHNQNKTVKMLESLSFNCNSHLWAEKNFDSTYRAKWIPDKIPTLILSGDNDHITPLKLFAENKQFQKKNILLREIKNAAHFPWIDNPEQVKELFLEFSHFLILK